MGMRTCFVMVACLLIVLFMVVPSAADDPLVITGDGVYLARPGGSPTEIGFDENGRLDTSVPPGSSLYFAIDNATIASHVAGYTATIRCIAGEECVELPVAIRYEQLFDSTGRNGVYHYAVQVAFYALNYEEAPILDAYVSVGTPRDKKPDQFRFAAIVQEGPLEEQMGIFSCPPDPDGLTVFVDDKEDNNTYMRLLFDDMASFSVRTGRQRPLDLSYINLVDLRIAEYYPEGEFVALTFPGEPVFDNKGTLRIFAPDAYHLHEVTDTGIIAPTYSYDEEEGCFMIEPRRLGSYLLSTVALPGDLFGQFKQNPPTGAAS